MRLKRSLAERVTAGEDWRARLEAVIAAAYPPVVVKAAPRAAPKQPAVTRPFVSRLKGEWKAP